MKKILFFFMLMFSVLNTNAQTNISGIINDYAAVSSVNVCSNNVLVNSAAAFSVGDSVLLVQMKGATMNTSNSAAFGDLINLNNAGNYEYNIIDAISGNTITFLNTLVHAYDVAGLVQLVNVPSYTGNVNVTATLTAQAWNGTTGGILAFNVGGTLTLNADLDVSGLGFRGGANVSLAASAYNCNAFTNPPSTDYFFTNNTQFGSGKGEGIAVFPTTIGSGRGKSLNGGGGGNQSQGGGAGGGGYGQGGNGSLNDEPSFFTCDGQGGIAGLAFQDVSKFIFPGGGGAGHGNNATYNGGNAGGLIFVKANSLVPNGNSILSNGSSVAIVGRDGGSGGGAGGVIVLDIPSSTSFLVSVQGGDGGDVNGLNSDDCQGPGGGGGGGLILNHPSLTFTTALAGGIAGVMINSTSACNGLNSQNGSVGSAISSNSLAPDYGSPFASLSSIAASSPPDTLEYCQGQNATITIHPTAPVNVQWQVNSGVSWTNLVNDATYMGVDDTTLIIVNVQPSLSGNLYRAFLYNSCDSFYLDSSVLVVKPNGLVTLNPINQIVCLNDSASFFANGSDMISYVWQSDELGIFLDLANNATYSNVDSTVLNISNATSSLDGVLFRLQMMDDCGNTFFSNSASLTIASLDSISAQSTDTTICEFSDAFLYISVTNTADSIYWQEDSGAGFVDIVPANNNDTLNLNSVSATSSGNFYRAILMSTCAKDTSINVELTVIASSSTTINDTICDNQTYTLPNGSMVNIAGTYIDTFQNSNGCDSSVQIILAVNPSYLDTIIDNSCNPLDTGVSTVNDMTILGCDSITTTITSLVPSFSDTINVLSCNPSDTGMVILNDTTIFGCDSITTTITSFGSSNIDTINLTSCNAIDTGIVTVNDTTVLGCDSITTTITSLLASYLDTINMTSCNIIDTGIVIVNDTTTLGCDSITTTITSLLASYSDTLNMTSCNVIDTGIVIVNDTTTLGCDSITTTITSLLPSYSDTINLTSCNPLDTGTVILNDTTTFGCDSIVTTITSFGLSYSDTINSTSCNALDTGIVILNDTTVLGCDSITTTITTFLASSNTNSTDTICDASTFTLPSGLMVNVSGVYLDTLMAINTCDSIITTNLTVLPSINLTIMPTDMTVCEDSSAMFFVTATGTDITYQWQVNLGFGFNNISASTNDTLIIANVNSPINLDGAIFRVVLNSYCGITVNSSSALLSIATNVVLNSNPTNTVVCEGTDTVFNVTTNGNETNAQWQVNNGAGFVNVVNNANYSGSTTLSLSIQNTPLSFNANTYRLIVSDNCGFSDTTNMAALTVNPSLAITLQATNQNECAGNNVQFVISATNATSYQWQVNTGVGFTNIAGETNDTLNILSVTPTMNGNFYQCVVTNNCGTITSNSATLTVGQVGNVVTEPSDVIICPEGPGFNFDLTIVAENISSYQWQIDTGAGFVNIPANFLNISGENTNSLEITVPYNNVDGANFRVVTTDDCGTAAISNEYNVVVKEPDSIIGIDDVESCQRAVDLIEVDYDGVNYVWNDAAATTGRFFTPTESGEYVVTFTQNSTSCQVSDTINVTLRDCLAECVVIAPTGFSPLGSFGFNDVFRAIYGCELDFFELIVVNRWGEIIFSSNDPDAAWDGTYKGSPMPVASYVWYISYNKEGNNNKEFISGNVNLIK